MAEFGDDEDAPAAPPDEMKALRACKVCTLVKTFTQFVNRGCDNCEWMELADREDRVAECTSAFFEGMISVVSPGESWVARWQRLDNLKPGVYAMEVTGELPDFAQRYADERGIRPRAKPVQT